MQFILEPIWRVYEAVEAGDEGALDKIVKAIGVAVPPRQDPPPAPLQAHANASRGRLDVTRQGG
jgi:hypothetical protein